MIEKKRLSTTWIALLICVSQIAFSQSSQKGEDEKNSRFKYSLGFSYLPVDKQYTTDIAKNSIENDLFGNGLGLNLNFILAPRDDIYSDRFLTL